MLTAGADGGARTACSARSPHAPSADQLAVATFNVENLAPADPQTKFDRLAGQIVHNLRSPDLVAVEEIQDNSGATNDGTVASDLTVGKLVAAIRRAGGPAYQSQEIDPVDGADGGQPGGNIRQVFLFRTDRGLGFVDRAPAPGTDLHDAGRRCRASAASRSCPSARAASTRRNAAWNASRKPLVGQFKWHGPAALRHRQPLQLQGRRQRRSSAGSSRRCARARSSATSRPPRSAPFVDQIQAVDRDGAGHRAGRPERLRVLPDGGHPGRCHGRTRWSTCRGRCRRTSGTPTSSTATARCSTTS